MKRKNTIETICVVALFLVAAIAYFAPQLEGQRMKMHDQQQYENSVVDIENHYKTTGQDPQWSGSNFGGMPSYTIDFKMPTRLFWQATRYIYGPMGHPITIVFFAMLFFWIMLLLWGGIGKQAAAIPALAYGFSTYTILIIGAGHISKGYAIAYAPLLLGAVIYTYRSRKIWTGAALSALGGTMLIVAGHPQITYYFMVVLVVLVLWKLVSAVRDRWLRQFAKATGALAIAAVVALGANAVNLYYTNEATRTSTRGGSELTQESGQKSAGLDWEYATAWSYGKMESLNTFIPNLMGGASDGGFSADGAVANSLRPYGQTQLATQLPTYWGRKPYTAGPTYIGALLIFLAILTLFTVKGRLKWWLVAITALGFMFAWGGNIEWFTRLCRSILPGYNKFRSLDTGLVIAQWSIPVMAAMAVGLLGGKSINIERERLVRGVTWATAITGGTALFFLIFGGWIFNFRGAMAGQLPESIVTAMQSELASMMRMDALRSLLFVLAGAGVVLLFVYGKLKRTGMLVALAALAAVDLVAVDNRYVDYTKFEYPRTVRPTEANIAILQDTTLGYRVADLSVSTFNDASAARFHRSIGGYSAAKLQRYQDIIDSYLVRRHPGVYNMLNVRYFITPNGAQYNPEANGAAWFVEKVIPVGSVAEELASLDTVDLKRYAVTNREAQAADYKLPDGSIELVAYTPNKLTYKYSSDGETVAVFSEIYYPYGWTVTVDGNQADYFRADYILRAMQLPAGEHTIIWSFRAPNYAAVSQITLWFSIVLALWLVAVLILNIRKNGREEH